MLYAFGDYELDAGKVELRCRGDACPVEPQVFDLLLLLVENRERMVSRDEIIERVWHGRIVSDAALASRVKSARRAVGDDGDRQAVIRTVHGRGFRFVAEIVPHGGTVPATAAAPPPAIEASETPPGHAGLAGAAPSVAVLPFRVLGEGGGQTLVADAVAHELIVALSRLRWLFVIARGSSFRFRSGEGDVREIGRLLGVRYCLSGAVELFGAEMTLVVELADTHAGAVVWGDSVSARLDDIHEVRDGIVAGIVSALELHIAINEARAARLSSPENLDAWSAFHLGLQHMYRFTKADNEAASGLFSRAVALEPGFARAHAGLSFTHFQNAFLDYTGDPDGETLRAARAAGRSVELDPLDPFANFAMGRSFWLNGDLGASLAWLDRANALCPNYAQGKYARAWTDMVMGQGGEARGHVDAAMALSPLDPLHYAMLATRALSHIVDGELAEGAHWADRAARAPGAHVMILLIAIFAHALSGDREKAAAWAARLRASGARTTQGHFFRSFPFEDPGIRSRISRALAEHGI